MTKHTPLHDLHVQQGALMVNFAGWDMPLHYGSQMEEHKMVREAAGMFDVSHMGILDVVGRDARTFLRYLLANDVGKLQDPGQALYTCLLNAQGCVIDDLIVYQIDSQHYRLIVNAASHEKDWAWIQEQAAPFSLDIIQKPELGIIAVQGPQARAIVGLAFPLWKNRIDALAPFHFFEADGVFIARTGYTGEDGVEIILPAIEAVKCWQALSELGVKPIGLGARDTLRLEAGFNLYGQDMDENESPLESNLAWTLAFEPTDRAFIGRAALEAKQKVIHKKLLGLILQDKGVLRQGQRVLKNGRLVGVVTSGTFSPSLKCAIALARIDSDIMGDCEVEIRNQPHLAKIVKPPFVRRTKT